ncbi:hypothetical protein FHW67_003867 [Herbaspirillum sp. Sphag1AN]|uniref:type II toxin-antitoxin system HipA family toxin YjjJ n=1 Tax=unclassified Herbaspirillum TaxID=2624150 RepID=UPI00160C6FF5|nr:MULTISPECIES: type II toxin-antitoxin system HipA family toxin YjjJ [unclassified Herbaspirillum]MBB3214546.1 hypothetical protein [Herbaspirillum sp. Sphag1AN]MBB3247692.1 hypothetical protein [Herbaspirillum sp. Sphag64]
MTDYVDQVRLHLGREPLGARQLIEKIGISQPTLSRTITAMGNELVRIGAARSIQYALRDQHRGIGDIVIYRVAIDGRLSRLGILMPVCPEGFVMQQEDGRTLHSHSLPWWLLDMRPQGFLGRAYVSRHAATLGLPKQLSEWNDTHILRAMVAHGHDAVGNLLLGELGRERFLDMSLPAPIANSARAEVYVHMALQASSGELPGSSAGGEQPKFVAFVDSSEGPRHVLVKFSQPESDAHAAANPVSQRWRDLLLAEHHALTTLREGGVAAARTSIVDHDGQRFLEVERFDRVGVLGRRGLFSLAAVEAEFVGNASAPWPEITQRLVKDGQLNSECAEGVALLYAFGSLIGNTDMHHGNLSFTTEEGRPYRLAPAYDMLPMGFAPRASGALPDQLMTINLRAAVSTSNWHKGLALAKDFLLRIEAEVRFSADFQRCIASLQQHIAQAESKLSRLA